MERHKKLIEVALPLAAINKETAREKSYGISPIRWKRG
jgi:adenine-specific DNA methylase